MAVRPIDAVQVLHNINSHRRPTPVSEFESGFNNGLNQAMWEITHAPTLTQPNEPLTLISMSDELPPDNERVLVYRLCMVDSDIGPYSVQWGWAAKRDGSHWARLPGRRPPEGEEEI